MSETGVIVFAHGSRVAEANDAVKRVTGQFAQSSQNSLVEAAFLELSAPELSEAADNLIARGARRLIVLPYFLMPGIHLQRDLPALVAEIAARHPDVPVEVRPSLDGHPALVEILLARAAESI
jgi:sirohydrochlorin ferrochelatase